MKNIFILLISLSFIVSCSKDGISPKDKRNDCEDCILESKTVNSSGITTWVNTMNKETYEFTHTNINGSLSLSWCDYLSSMDGKSESEFGNTTTYTVNCK